MHRRMLNAPHCRTLAVSASHVSSARSCNLWSLHTPTDSLIRPSIKPFTSVPHRYASTTTDEPTDPIAAATDTTSSSRKTKRDPASAASSATDEPSLRAPKSPPESQRPLSYKPSSPAAVPLVSPFMRSSSHSSSSSSTPAHANAPSQYNSHTNPNRYDLVVIGSGPAGQKCAINAAKNRKRVAIIDRRDMFGGVCIHTGTIPSKTFREAVLYLTGYRQRGFYGKGFIRRDDISSTDILERVSKVEQWETQTILDQLHRNRVTTIQGTAKFIDAHRIEVTPESMHAVAAVQASSAPHIAPLTQPQLNEKSSAPLAASHSSSAAAMPLATSMISHENNVIEADHVLICCGTKPARNPMYPFDSSLIFDADALLQNASWDKIRHLIVIGAGVIAMEYASMFNNLPGCRVTIIDEKQSILEFVDEEVVQTLKHIMGRQGATFRLGEKVTAVEANDREQTVRVKLESGKTVIGDALFYAVGRQANTDSLNLQAAGVATGKRGLIPVNEFFQTNVSHIYAGGDVIGFPALASTAMEQGRLASQHMWGAGRIMKPVFPYGIYTIPEISVIGQSEQELTRLRIPYECGIAKFEETAKGQMIGGQHIDGFLKLLFCPHTRRLLGCAAIGESAVEIIHIGQVVMSMGQSIEYLRDSVFNYPTMAETYRVAALDGLGRLGISS